MLREIIGGTGVLLCLAGGAVLPAAAQRQPAQLCRIDGRQTLPAEVRETSGLARGRRSPGVLWTHNDSGAEPELFALDEGGRVVGRVRVEGAEARDWEDLEAGPCEGGSCLYVADTGDNAGRREEVVVYRVPEPAPGDERTAPAVALRARYPEGPRDAEALFVLPGGEVFVVTKGRHDPVTLYRFPAPLRPGETVTLERVRELRPRPVVPFDWVTAATASPNGEWVGVRSYRALYLYRAAELTGSGAAEPLVVDLAPLAERQGEAVAIDDDGTVWLTSEAETEGLPGMSRLRCTLPRRRGR